uniref:Uncharacterized protein n=1 Tax=Arundo donax TaxID=35708 RepID=A0A0A9HBY9_ARUDO
MTKTDGINGKISWRSEDLQTRFS